MNTVPLTFDPSVGDYNDGEHLVIRKAGDVYEIRWDILDVKILSAEEEYPDFEVLEKLNPTLTFYSQYGYSLAQFHEFFIEPVPENFEMKLGRAEASIGEVTPLGAFLFQSCRDEHIHGEWEDMKSVRILGVKKGLAEAYLINALHRYSQKYDFETRIWRLGPVDYWEPPTDVLSADGNVSSYPPLTIDIEPLICFYHALRESDHGAACIQYYRVLEYYAFFSLQHEISGIRHNRSVSDRDFLLKARSLLTREEKSPLIRLVISICDASILDRARKVGLLDVADAGKLAGSLYEFRNSIVHAKFGHKGELVVDSLFARGTDTEKWREILQNLAWAALNVYGNKDL